MPEEPNTPEITMEAIVQEFREPGMRGKVIELASKYTNSTDDVISSKTFLDDVTLLLRYTAFAFEQYYPNAVLEIREGVPYKPKDYIIKAITSFNRTGDIYMITRILSSDIRLTHNTVQEVWQALPIMKEMLQSLIQQ